MNTYDPQYLYDSEDEDGEYEYEYVDYGDEEYYYDEEDDYEDQAEDLYPQYQSSFFSPDSPITRFMAERNQAHSQK